MSYIYRTLSTSDIVQELLADVKRGNANWSYNGAEALAEYLVEYTEQTDTPVELDVVALRCDYSEYKDLEAFNAENGDEYILLDILRDDAGVVLEFDGGIIVSSF